MKRTAIAIAAACIGAFFSGEAWGQNESQFPAESTNYVAVVGSTGQGARDLVEVVFFEIPSTVSSNLYFAVRGAGKTGVAPDEGTGGTTTYYVVGGSGTYSEPASRAGSYADTSYLTGTPLRVFQVSGTAVTTSGTDPDSGLSYQQPLDSSGTALSAVPGDNTSWVYFPAVSPTQGELVGSKQYFKVIAVHSSIAGQQKNGFQLDVSLAAPSTSPIAVSGAKSFAYSWTIDSLDSDGLGTWSIYPFVPDGSTGSVSFLNFDMDNTETASYTNIDGSKLAVSVTVSTNGGTANTDVTIDSGTGVDTKGTWLYQITEVTSGTDPNVFELWVTNGGEGLKLYSSAVATVNVPTPYRVVMTPEKTAAATSEQVSVALQIVDIDGNPVDYRQNIFVAATDGGGTEPTITPDSTTANSYDELITTDASGAASFTINDPDNGDTVNIALYTDGVTGGSDNFGAGTDDTASITFSTNPLPTIASLGNTSIVEGAADGTLQRIEIRDTGTQDIGATDLRLNLNSGSTGLIFGLNTPTVTVKNDSVAATGVVNTAARNATTTLFDITFTTPLAAGDYLVIDGLHIDATSASVTSDTSFSLQLDYNNDGTYEATDSRTITVTDASAPTYTYIGSDGVWATASNWTPSGPPANGASIVVSETATSGFPLGLPATVTTLSNVTVEANAFFSLGTNPLTVSYALSNAGTIRLAGSQAVTLTGGNDTDSGTWEYTGSGALTIGVNDYYDLTFSNAGAADAGASNLNVYGDFTHSSGTFTSSGTISFLGSAVQALTNAGATFGNVTVNNSGAAAVTATADVSLSGALTLTSGTLSISTGSLQSGSISFSGGYVEANTIALDLRTDSLSYASGGITRTAVALTISQLSNATAMSVNGAAALDLTSAFLNSVSGTTLLTIGRSDATADTTIAATHTFGYPVAFATNAANSVAVNAAIATATTAAYGITFDAPAVLAANVSTDCGAVTFNRNVTIGAASVTIDTDTGDDEAAGNIVFAAGSVLSASAAAYDLTLDARGATRGNVTLRTADASATAAVNNLAVYAAAAAFNNAIATTNNQSYDLFSDPNTAQVLSGNALTVLLTNATPEAITLTGSNAFASIDLRTTTDGTTGSDAAIQYTDADGIDIARILTGTASGSATVTATAGAITQTGIIETAALSTSSTTGTTLNSANVVSSFSASNATSGGISLTNSTALTVPAGNISQYAGGTVTILNTGAIVLTGTIDAGAAGTISIDTGDTTTITGTGTLTAGTVNLQTIAGSGQVGTSSASPISLAGASGTTLNLGNGTTALAGAYVSHSGSMTLGTLLLATGNPLYATAVGLLAPGTSALSLGSGSIYLSSGTSLTIAGAGTLTTTTGQIDLLANGGALAINAAVANDGASGSIVNLASTSGITQTAAIVAGTLRATNAGAAMVLDHAGNAFTTIGTIDSAGQNVTLNHTASATAYNAELITADSLRLLGTGSYSLTNANVVTTLAGNVTGAMSFTSAGGVSIGTVTTVGLTSAATISLTASSGTITQTASSVLSATTLNLSASGSITLNEANTVTNLGTVARGGTFTFNDSGALTVAGTVTGGTTTNDVSIASTGLLTVNAAISATGTGTASLIGAGVTVSAAVTGEGGITVDAGTGAFTNTATTGSLTRGAAAGAAITITADSIDLGAGSSVSAGTGAVIVKPTTLNTALGVGSSAAGFNLTAAEINTIATGNSLALGDATNTGTITVSAATALTVAGAVTILNGSSDIAVNASLSAAAALALQSAAAITDNGSGSLASGGNLTLSAVSGIGAIAGNPINIGSVAGISATNATSGDIFLSTAGATSIGVAGFAISQFAGGDVRIDSGGNISIDGDVGIGTGALTLNATGTITRSGAFTLTAGTLNMGTAGATTDVGASGTAITTISSNLAAQASTGPIWISNTGALASSGIIAAGTTVNIDSTGALSIGHDVTGPGGVALTVSTAETLFSHTAGTIDGTDAAIVVTADKMDLVGTIGSATTDIVTLRNFTTTNAVDLGSAVDTTANTLELSGAELTTVIGALTVGRSDGTGAITVSAGTTRSSAGTTTLLDSTGGIAVDNALSSVGAITLTTAAGVSGAGAISTASQSLTVNAQTTISLTGANTVQSVNLFSTVTGGNIDYTGSSVGSGQTLNVTAVVGAGTGSVSVSETTGSVSNTAGAITASGASTVAITAVEGTAISNAVTGPGGVTITVTGTDATLTHSAGAISATNSDIALVADDMALTGGTIGSGTGNVSIYPNDTAQPIDLGTDAAGASLGLTDAELDTITVTSPGLLTVGRTTHTGAVAISAAISPAGANGGFAVVNRTGGIDIQANVTAPAGLALTANGGGAAAGAITRSGGTLTATTGNLTLDAATGIGVIAGPAPVYIAVPAGNFSATNTTSGDLCVYTTGDVTIGVAGFALSQVAGGDVRIDSGGNLVINGNVNIGTGILTLNAVGTITEQSAGAGTLTAGTANLGTTSATTVGTLAAPILTAATTLSAAATTGAGVFLTNTGNASLAASAGSGAVNVSNTGTLASGGAITAGTTVAVTSTSSLSIGHAVTGPSGVALIAATDFSHTAATAIQSTDTAVSIQANTIDLSAGTVSSGAANTYLYPFTAATASSLGGAAGFDLTGAELNTITAAAIVVGEDSGATRYSGAMTIGASAAVALGARNITVSGTNIQGGANPISTTGTLALKAANGIGDATAINSAASTISFANTTATIVDISNASASGLSLSGTNAGAAVTVTETSGLAMTVNASNIATAGGALTLVADDMTITGTIGTGAGNVTLYPYSVGGTISIGSGGSGLGLADGELDQITTTGTLTIGEPLTHNGAIAVDGNTSITTASGPVYIRNDSGGGITITAGSLSSTGNLFLYSGGAIAGTNTVTTNAGTGTLTVSAAGGIGLTNASNAAAIVSLTNATGGNISYVNNHAMTATASNTAAGGTISVTNATGAMTVGAGGIASAGAGAANITLVNSAAGMAVNGAVTAGGTGYVSLSSAGLATQGAVITAPGGLVLLGAGPYTLNTQDNAVSTIAAQTTGAGAIQFNSAAALAVGSVNGTDGITTVGGNATLTTAAGNLTVSQPIDTSAAAGGTIALNPAGAIDLNYATAVLTTNNATIGLQKAVTVSADSVIASGTAATTFSSTIDDSAAATHTIQATGPTTLTGNVGTTALLQFTVNGTTTLAGSISVAATTVDFAGSIVGAGNSLSITGASTLGSLAANTLTGLTSLSVTGTCTLNANTVTTTAGGQTFSTNVLLNAGASFNFTAPAGQTVSFGGTLGGGGTARAVTISTANASFGGNVGGAGNLATSLTVNTGTTALNAASITTTGAQSYAGTVTLGVDSTLTATGTPALSFAAITGGQALHLDAGAAGTVSVSGIVGTTPLTTLEIVNSAGTTFSSSVSAAQFTITDSAAASTVSIVGNLTLTTGMTVAGSANAYNVSIGGIANSIAGATSFANTGTLAVGQAGGDTYFIGGASKTNAAKTFAGTVRSNNADLDFGTAGLVSIPQNTVFNPGSGTLTLFTTSVTAGRTLTLGTGAASVIATAGISGTAASANLTINTTAAATIGGAVGANIGTLTITNSGGTTFQSTVGAASVVLTATTGTIEFDGALTVSGAISTAAAPTFNLAFNQLAATTTASSVGAASTLSNTGTLTFGNDATDSMTFTAGLVATSQSGKTIYGSLAAAGTGVLNLGGAGPVYAPVTSTIGGSSTGQITLAATQITAGATLTVGAGATTPVSIGAVTQTAAFGNLSVNTIGAVTVNAITLTGGTVDMTASQIASLTQSAGTIAANLLRIDSAAAVGSPLATAVTYLEIRSGAGVSVSQTGNLIVGAAGGLTGVSSTGAGNIGITSTGTITADEAIATSGAGTVTLEATSLDLATGGVSTGTGAVTLQPAANGTGIAVNDATGAFYVSEASLQAVATAGTLTIGRAAGTGAINIGSQGPIDLSGRAYALTLRGASSPIAFNFAGAAESLTLPASQILTLNAGGAIASPGSANADISISNVASILYIQNATNVGASGFPLTTAVGVLRATVSGALYVSESDALTLGGTTAIGAGAEVDISAGGAIGTANTIASGSNGNVSIASASSGITISNTVTANGSGNLDIAASGAGGLLTVNAALSSTSGNLTLSGATGVGHAAAGTLATGTAGTIDVTASANDITFASGTTYTAGSGDVTLSAAANVSLGAISTAGNVAVTATAGHIDEVSVAETANLTANVATLSAGTYIGDSTATGDIDTTLAVLNATAGNGGVYIAETNGIQLGGASTVQATSGDIVVNAAGAITTGNTVQTVTSGSLTVISSGSSVTLGNTVAAATTLTATAAAANALNLSGIVSAGVAAALTGPSGIAVSGAFTGGTGLATFNNATTNTGTITSGTGGLAFVGAFSGAGSLVGSSAGVIAFQGNTTLGTLTPASSTFAFTGTLTPQTFNTNGNAIPSTEISKGAVGNVLQIITSNVAQTASASLTMTAGTLDLATNSRTWTLQNSLAVGTNALVTVGAGTLNGGQAMTIGGTGLVTHGTGTITQASLGVSGTGAYTGTGTGTLALSGALSMSGGTLSLGTKTITAGTISVTGGDLALGSAQITLTGASGANTINTSGTITDTASLITMIGANATLALDDSERIGDLTISAANVGISDGNAATDIDVCTVTVAGSPNIASGTIASNGTTSVAGTLTASAGANYTSGAALTVSGTGSIAMSTGTLTAAAGGMSLTGSGSISSAGTAADAIAITGNLAWSGTASATMTLTGTGALSVSGNFVQTATASGSVTTASGGVSVTGQLTNYALIQITGGNLAVSGAGANTNAGTIETLASGTQTYTGTMANSGTITGFDLVTFTGDVANTGTINAGPAAAGSEALRFVANYSSSGALNGNATTDPDISFQGNVAFGTFTHAGDRILFYGSGAQTFNTGGNPLAGVHVAKSGGSVTLLTNNASQALSGGALTFACSAPTAFNLNGLAWTLGAACDVNANVAFNALAGTLNGSQALTVSADGVLSHSTGTLTLSSLSHSSTNASTLGTGSVGVSGTLAVSAGSITQTGDEGANLHTLGAISVSGGSLVWDSGNAGGDLTVSGAIAASAGTLDFGNKTVAAATLDVNGTANLALDSAQITLSAAPNRIDTTGSITDIGSRLTLAGAGGNLTLDTDETIGDLTVSADTTMIKGGLVKNLLIDAGITLNLNAAANVIDLLIDAASTVTANGTLRIQNDANTVTIASQTNGTQIVFNGTDIDYNANAVTLRDIDAAVIDTDIESGAAVTIENGVVFQNIALGGGLNMTAGSTLDANDLIAAAGSAIANGGANTITASGDVSILGSFTFSAASDPTLVMTGAGTTLTATPQIGDLTVESTASATLGSALSLADDLSIVSGGTLDASASNWKITIEGDTWNNQTPSGGFIPRAGEVEFTAPSGTVVSVSGNNDWYDFTCTVAGLTFAFENNKTQQFQAGGTFTLTGTLANQIVLTRQTGTDGDDLDWVPPATPDPTIMWQLDMLPPSSIALSYVTVKYSDARAHPIVKPDDVTVYSVTPDGTPAGEIGKTCFKWLSGLEAVYSFTEDSDDDGRIDRLRIRASAALNGDFSGFSIAVNGYDIDTTKGTNGYVLGSGSLYFFAYLVEKEAPDSDATPTWTIPSGSNTTLKDNANNKYLLGTIEEIMQTVDTAPPVPAYALTLPERQETYLRFSEPVYQTGGTVADYTSFSAAGSAETRLATSGNGTSEYLLPLSANPTVSTLAGGATTGLSAALNDNAATPTVDYSTDVAYLGLGYPAPEYATSYGIYGTYVETGSGGLAPPNRLRTADQTHRLTDVLVSVPPSASTDATYFVWPVWARDSVTTEIDQSVYDTLTGAEAASQTIGLVRDFTGTQWLRDQDITLESWVNAALGTPSAVRVHFAADVAAGYLASDANSGSAASPTDLWLPTFDESAYSVLVPFPYSGHSTVAGTNPSGQLWDFALSSSDANVRSVSTLDFYFTLGALNTVNPLYAARLDIAQGDPIPADWYTRVLPFSFAVHDVTKQRGSVTILNNVINPNNGETTRVSYQLSKAGRTTVQVFTLDGDLVDILYRGTRAAGDYTAVWDGKNRGGRAVARGIYFIRVVAPDIDEIRKVLVVK